MSSRAANPHRSVLLLLALAVVGCGLGHDGDDDPRLDTAAQGPARGVVDHVPRQITPGTIGLGGTGPATPDPGNTPPNAAADAFTVTEDSAAIAIEVLANDTDPDPGDQLFITQVSPAFNAIVTITGGGVGLTFQPGPNFNGPTSFTYTISDGHGGTATALVNVFVVPVNDAPSAVDDSVTVIENGGRRDLVVLDNDSDVDGDDTLSIAAVTQPADGTVIIASSGKYLQFQPSAGFAGVTTFTYTLSDGHGGTSTATVTVTVDARPIAVDDAFTVDEDAPPTELDVLANDHDPENERLTLIEVSRLSSGGGQAWLADGKIMYRPSKDFNGTATFMYTLYDTQGGTASATVTVTVNPVEDPPFAGDVWFPAVLEDSPAFPVDVLADCSDPDGDPLTIVAVTQPVGGSVYIIARGTIILFQPAPNSQFSTSFTYTISDGKGGTATATVRMDLAAVGDAPIAGDDAATVFEDSGETVIDVLANDYDPDVLDDVIITAVTQPAGGTTTNGRFRLTFQPAPNFFGLTTFTYTIADRSGRTTTATVRVTVTPVSDPPVAVDDGFFVLEDDLSVPLDVLANDADPDGDPLTITEVTQPIGGMVTINEDAKGLTLQPQPNFHRTVTFTYTVSDGHGGTAAATVRLGFFAREDPPLAVDDAATVAQDSGPTTIDVLANDTDVDGDLLTITAVTQPSDGLAAILARPTALTFQPDAGFVGTTAFTYTITDGQDTAGSCGQGIADGCGQQATSTATVTVHVTANPPDRGSCQIGADPAGGALALLIGGPVIAYRRRRSRAARRAPPGLGS